MNPAAPADLRPVDLPVVRDFMTTHQIASLQENCKLRIASRAIAFVPDLPLNDAAALLVAREVERLRLAELYHVSAEMTTLAVGASKTMPDFGLARADMPSDYGLMVFAIPIAVDVPEGEPHLRISAVSWGLWPHADSAFAPDGAVWVTLWSDTWDMFGDSMGDMVQQGRMSQAQLTAVCQPGNRLTCRGEFQWPFAPEISADDESLKVPSAGVLKCAWLLMQQQTIAESREEHLPKSGRRKLADRSADLMRTRVITLRRGVSEGGHSGSHREYLSRWVVRGHWRQQWYAHRGVHRPIWIAPHIKGPGRRADPWWGKGLRMEQVTCCRREGQRRTEPLRDGARHARHRQDNAEGLETEMKRCSAQAAVDGTLRQYWHCDRAGHEGQHLAVAPNGAVLKRRESS